MPHQTRKLLKSLDLQLRESQHADGGTRTFLESTDVRERDQYSKRLGRVKNNFSPPVIRRIPPKYNYFRALSRADSRDL
jgi:hypothetical protein